MHEELLPLLRNEQAMQLMLHLRIMPERTRLLVEPAIKATQAITIRKDPLEPVGRTRPSARDRGPGARGGDRGLPGPIAAKLQQPGNEQAYGL